ncbi:MAG TPA: redoxin domain-containing protein [Kofleriaceae bacterium]
MADDAPKPKQLPVATALAAKETPARGIVIDPRVVLAGGLVALVGVGLLAIFLWMVPNAAARESVAACRALGGGTDLGPNELRSPLCSHGDPQKTCPLPAVAPDFTAIDHEGKPIKLSDFRGKVVLLNFWASWCAVCKTEKPSLEAMAAEMAGGDFVVITVASDKHYADALAAVTESLRPKAEHAPRNEDGAVTLADAVEAYKRALPRGVPFRVLLDPPTGDDTIGPITKGWGIKAVPESVLIDRDGRIRAYFVNKRDWSAPVAQTCLRSVIDG